MRTGAGRRDLVPIRAVLQSLSPITGSPFPWSIPAFPSSGPAIVTRAARMRTRPSCREASSFRYLRPQSEWHVIVRDRRELLSKLDTCESGANDQLPDGKRIEVDQSRRLGGRNRRDHVETHQVSRVAAAFAFRP